MLKDILTTSLGTPVEDASEETFLLFSHDFPSHNLGFINGQARSVEVEIGSHDFIIQQSPGLLTSNREAGTTGAVLWKITPLVAAWLASDTALSRCGIAHDISNVVELGCGISGLIAMAMAKRVGTYVLTDQTYVLRLLRENLEANQVAITKPASSKLKKMKKKKRGLESCWQNIKVMSLDWELDKAENVISELCAPARIDLVVVCDCIYNDYLITPLVQTCVDLCRTNTVEDNIDTPTIVLVAQQLRSDLIFEAFMTAALNQFQVWRVPDECLPLELHEGSGYALHILVLK